MKLFEAAKRYGKADGITKDAGYYRIYDDAFANKYFKPTTMLEIGVYEGISTKIFAAAYPECKIVAIDLVKRDIDFSAFPHVIYSQGDQADQAMLRLLCEKFPDGIDLVIEDASHIGYLSKVTFETVFPYVRKGGLYIIEDWDTGYWDDWPDGSHYQNFPMAPPQYALPKRLPSHDYGMVGFVKSLLDVTSDIRPKMQAMYVRNRWIRSLEIHQGIVIAEKD